MEVIQILEDSLGFSGDHWRFFGIQWGSLGILWDSVAIIGDSLGFSWIIGDSVEILEDYVGSLKMTDYSFFISRRRTNESRRSPQVEFRRIIN